MALYRNLRVHQIFGGGTEIGKTIISTALIKASIRLGEQTSYLKPIGTGLQSDASHITQFVGSDVNAKCLYTFQEPVSPHLAAMRMSKETDRISTVIPTDEEFIHRVKLHIDTLAASLDDDRQGALYIESAGGVHSPTLSGSSQMLAYRPLRMPTILIGSPHLGGISSTISAYESLRLHGYDIDALVILREDYYRNWEYLEKWAQERSLYFSVIDRPPDRIKDENQIKDQSQMMQYYQQISNSEHSNSIITLVRNLQTAHSDRLNEFDSMATRAIHQIWWPFVQHSTVTKPSDVMVIDSASGDFFLKHQPKPSEPIRHSSSPSNSLLNPTFDGSASWWTQSVGHAHPEIALSVAHAAGRYGHVLFPRCIHPPAIHLTEWLLGHVGKGWADRVFFSDNGSTGVEVALKMGLASYSRRHHLSDSQRRTIGILGLRGSYHGDTIGAMDASEPSVYNSEVDWYSGRGFWLEPPQLSIIGAGQVRIEARGDQWSQTPVSNLYEDLHQVFDIPTRLRDDPLTHLYRAHLKQILGQARQRMCFGTLILEPVVMGAGGMIFVDPLFQNLLVQFVREHASLFDPHRTTLAQSDPDVSPEETSSSDQDWNGLPVVFDEVFSGLYRLGHPTAATLLGSIHPDLAVYSKILSAGTVPLSVTLARERIFESFLSPSTPRALLHGHSYTAHPIGCSVALTGLRLLERLKDDGRWNESRRNWNPTFLRKKSNCSSLHPTTESHPSSSIWSLWNPEFVDRICTSDRVESVMCLGSVLAIYLVDQNGLESGYTSEIGMKLIEKIQQQQQEQEQENEVDLLGKEDLNGARLGDSFEIHCRPLGKVVYLICSLNTELKLIEKVEKIIEKAIFEFN
ncbi:pyridoxal phosphate-dependent transferase [Melampsora americana]|nr:pyridoxal phosphate-dependent transferase [Melampsora americana]